MRPEPDTPALVALLDWYQAMGVDTAVADTPVNWLEHGDAPPGHGFRLESDAANDARAPEPAPTSHAPGVVARSEPAPARTRGDAGTRDVTSTRATPPARPFAAAPVEAAERAARSMAKDARTLDDLEAALKAFDGCGLKATAKNLCFYRGAREARLMLIGEAPGRDEDIAGLPFVGRAGQLLDKMLASIGLKEADVHITNVVYWRPPGNRTPTTQETEICRPFLERQMELVEPEIVLVLGGAAAKQVLSVTEGIMRVRGRWREIQSGERTVRAMATLHPAYLLRTPAAKRQAWRDLLAVQAALDGAGKSAG